MQRRRSEAYKRAVQRAQRSRKFLSWGRHRAAFLAEKVSHAETPRRTETFEEKHYTPAELGEKWGLSTDTMRDIFEKEPDVLRKGDPRPRSGRKYVTLRIPESVARRVHRRLSAMPAPIKLMP